MDLEEAQKLAELASTAGAGNTQDVGYTCNKLNSMFPGYTWSYDKYALWCPRVTVVKNET